jgi:cytidine deaminase
MTATTGSGLPDPDDRKLVVLARSARARTRSAQGAAVRDLDGRTYAAATVELPSLTISALALAVAMASSSGATGLEAAAVVADDDGVGAADLAVVADFAGAEVPVFVADARGNLRTTAHS